MTNIEKIRQEIERRMKELERDKYININAKACRQSELKYLERFIDSLPEEKPSEDLEEAAEEYFVNTYGDGVRGDPVDDFIAGAEWQKEQMELDGIVTLTESDFDAEKEKASEWGYNLCKEQMMKDAVDYKIVNNLAAYPVIYYEVNHLGLKYGDKVKLIIVKQ